MGIERKVDVLGIRVKRTPIKSPYQEELSSRNAPILDQIRTKKFSAIKVLSDDKVELTEGEITDEYVVEDSKVYVERNVLMVNNRQVLEGKNVTLFAKGPRKYFVKRVSFEHKPEENKPA